MERLYVVGIGPGKKEYFTAEAMHALEASDVIYGYPVYTDLVKPLFPDKDYRTTGMRQETERCRQALQCANDGQTTALVCSGDAGVYGMASPVLELAEQYPDVDICVVAGVTAALSGAAVLGAPLSNDFCVISLSDLLTPWELIERRLKAAAMGDFSIALYNPSSKKRKDHLQRACDILLTNGKSPETVCGFVRNIGRDGEEKTLTTLAELRDTEVDMFTTVFIGTVETTVLGDRMVTPRGYDLTGGNA
ncbi:MAG: precorrin-3B C(17)-methyltransferase [Clostridia bacterium]|nr:precorrin-3B C(17)-methyltransferase [Clostridia bacterium]MBQ8925102.1 precorrin-3B C(17)-methyltransferase [Clostridia bacterium]